MLELSYILLSLIMLTLIIVYVFGYLNRNDFQVAIKRKWKIQVALIPLIWLIYITILSYSEVLRSTELPPRIPFLLFFPFVVFLIRFYVKNKNSQIVQNIPLVYTTSVQSFRILVEIILLYSFDAHLVPKAATFEGFNFDILMGISAPFVAYFGFIKRQIPKGILVFWNVLGILMVLTVGVIIANAFYAPNELIEVHPKMTTDFVVLPYLLIPAVLAPMAIFFHVVSLIQLRALKP